MDMLENAKKVCAYVHIENEFAYNFRVFINPP